METDGPSSSWTIDGNSAELLIIYEKRMHHVVQISCFKIKKILFTDRLSVGLFRAFNGVEVLSYTLLHKFF